MDPLPLFGTITAGTAALAAIIWIGRGLWRMASRIAELHDDWQGEPDRPGVKGRKGVMQRLSAIEAELTINGGRSVKDTVNAISRQLAELQRTSPPVQVNVGTVPTADSTSSYGGTT